jgi:hypothetical protein
MQEEEISNKSRREMNENQSLDMHKKERRKERVCDSSRGVDDV